VKEVIRREFEVDEKNSVDKRQTEPDRFGYRAVNLVCTHLGKRATDVEYKKFSGISFEIQVTSILGHAWSEIEHEWYDLREAYPAEIKRRFARLVALFEIADNEFLEIRDRRARYERSVTLRVEAKAPNIPVDAVSLKAFIEQEPLVAEIDNQIGPIMGLPFGNELLDVTLDLRSKALKLAGLTTLQDVREKLNKYKTAILEFVSRCKNENVWVQGRGSRLQRGVATYHLAYLLVNMKGSEAALGFLQELQIEPKSDLVRQSAIAQEVGAKY
jgi:hypothetical protein